MKQLGKASNYSFKIFVKYPKNQIFSHQEVKYLWKLCFKSAINVCYVTQLL